MLKSHVIERGRWRQSLALLLFRVTASWKCPGGWRARLLLLSSSSSFPPHSSLFLLLLPDSPKPNPCSHRGCAGIQPSTAPPPHTPCPLSPAWRNVPDATRIRSWLTETCGRSSLLFTFHLFACFVFSWITLSSDDVSSGEYAS